MEKIRGGKIRRQRRKDEGKKDLRIPEYKLVQKPEINKFQFKYSKRSTTPDKPV